jgi:GntR family transcriptional regulator
MLTYHASRAEAADRPDDWRTDAYFTEVRQQGHQPSQTFDMRLDPASLTVAQRLQIPEGEAVVVRRMIRYVDGESWSIQDGSSPWTLPSKPACWFRRPAGGIVRAMAEHGHVEIGYRDELTTRMPTPDEAQTLDLGAGYPCWPMCAPATPRSVPCASPKPSLPVTATAWSTSWATSTPSTSVTADA